MKEIIQLRFPWFTSCSQTKGRELEDVDHLIENGGLTGGVFESRGYPAQPGYHRTLETDRIEKPIGVEIENVCEAGINV